MAAAKKRAHFSKELFSFLKALANHNEKVWFEANRGRYEQAVKTPIIEFIGDFAGPLRKISKHYVADPRPNGGSMFRIYRDVRFSKNKAPYKTHAAAHFRHEETANDVHAPAYYLHLAPGEVFMGAGIWHPEPPTAAKIRDRIVEKSAGWKKALADKEFKKYFEMRGESLTRPPRGYDPEHPLIDELKRKDFIAVAQFSEKEACAPGFLERFTETCRAATPLMKFLTEAVELKF